MMHYQKYFELNGAITADSVVREAGDEQPDFFSHFSGQGEESCISIFCDWIFGDCGSEVNLKSSSMETATTSAESAVDEYWMRQVEMFGGGRGSLGC